jgi:alkylation response protein AidB-like acyl-CoA dehydrogenase
VTAVEYELNEEQHALADTVRALLTKRSDSAAVRSAMDAPRGYDEGLWDTLCQEIGVAGLAIPEEFGGLGASLVEMHVVLEELGRTLTPSPLLGSSVVAAQALLASEDREACERLLPDIASGATIATLAWAPAEGQWSPERPACVADETSTLEGEAHYVLDGDIAHVLLVAASTGSGVGLFEVDVDGPGVHREAVPAMDPTRRLATVRLSGARGRRVGHADGVAVLRHVRDIACVALSAEQVGAAARSLELTVEHTKQRKQFGRPIGSFQALKHRMADAFVLVEAARSISYAAVFAAARDDPGLAQEAAVARIYCSEALRQVTSEMIQLHGGIAITWEHDAQLYFKRAHGSSHLFGAPEEHLERFAHLAGITDSG